MTVDIRRGSDRFVDRMPGRATSHAFSFGAHYDAAHVGFAAMVCHDDHLLGRGQGFPPHRHAGLVIVSWVLSGSLTHVDSSGASTEVGPGSVGVLRAGSGVEHSEVASAPHTRFVQVWLTMDADEAEPSYDVRPVGLVPDSFVEAARPLPGVRFWVARLDAGRTVTLPAAPQAHVFVARGALTRFSLAEPLQDGDALLLVDEPAHQVTAAVPTELLVWTFE